MNLSNKHPLGPFTELIKAVDGKYLIPGQNGYREMKAKEYLATEKEALLKLYAPVR